MANPGRDIRNLQTGAVLEMLGQTDAAAANPVLRPGFEHARHAAVP